MVVIAVAGIGLLVFSSGDDADESANDAQMETSQSDLDDAAVDALDEPQPTEETQLVAVGGYEGSGTATRTISGDFLHEVVAELGPPADGDFYEGWLVGPTVVSTGPLIDEGGGMWSLVFGNEDDLSQHNQVVITEETADNGFDGIPEDHVLEGSF